MRGRATWLILIAVGAVVTAGLVDAVRGSSSNPEAAQDGLSVTEPSTTMALPAQTTEAMTTTESLATTEPVNAPVTAIESAAPERLPSCETEQLRLAFTVDNGLAALELRRVTGEPCHHGRSPIGFTRSGQSGTRCCCLRIGGETGEQLGQRTSRTASCRS